MSATRESTEAADHNFVVVASRLPVDRVGGPDGQPEWQTSPGGLVTALEPVMREVGGAWIGWSGEAGAAPGGLGGGGPDPGGPGPFREPGRALFEGLCKAPPV